jgi:galactokinase
MWRFSEPLSYAVPDANRFLARFAVHAGDFDRHAPIAVARAPGRLDLMGGIADYSGALVLQLPLACAAWAVAQWSAAPAHAASVRSIDPAGPGGRAVVEVPLEALLRSDYAAVRRWFARHPASHWAAYALGALTVLHAECGAHIPRGVRLLLASDVPPGKGVSSSAALEVAAMQAVGRLLGLRLEGRQLALLCQKVENLVVGAPCGVMDQMTSACGQQGSLLALLCQPAELQPPVHLPLGLEVWAVDSGIRHAVSGADYASVRVGAFMGYRILGHLAGLAAVPSGAGRVTLADPLWGGYLANVTPAEWEARFRDRVPVAIRGADFLAAYGGFADTLTRIDPAATYAVRQPTAHPIYEHARVMRFRELLSSHTPSAAALEELGTLMYQSHDSYTACGLGSDGTDLLVEMVREVGPVGGLYGAKITGGGSGGSVAVLARAGSRQQVAALAQAYAVRTGRSVQVLGGSSPGAVQFGTHTLHYGS